MADLMTGTYDYQKLQNQYHNFSIPAIRIKVDGTELVAKSQLAVKSMKIQLSLSAASSVVFKIGQLYSLEKHAMKSDIKNKFKLGTIVEIEIGYLSSTLNIFKGYVARVGVEFAETASLVVTLMDARRLMMVSGTKQVLYEVKNYSDAVQKVLGSYSKLCSVKMDATKDNLTRPVSQNQNDYDFITKDMLEKAKLDREFFILGGTAYFRKPQSAKSPIMTMSYGKELLSLSMQQEYKDLSIEVAGYDPVKQEVVSAKQKVTKPSGQKNLLSQSPVCTVVDSDADTKEKAQARAAALARREAMRGNKAEAVTVGLPELVPGRFVKVKALEQMADLTYYITDVVHELNEHEFLTRVTMTF